MTDARCAAPACPELAVPSLPFCATHQLAPAGRRGGWLSARRRAMAHLAGGELDASMIVERGKIGRGRSGGLWVGAAPSAVLELHQFSMLVLCAVQFQPQRESLAFAGKLLHAPMYDRPDKKPSREEVGRALAASRRVAEEMERGGTVLVTCMAGINRSALVAALALLRATKMSAAEVIALIRARRMRDCLFNGHFRQLVERFATSPARR